MNADHTDILFAALSRYYLVECNLVSSGLTFNRLVKGCLLHVTFNVRLPYRHNACSDTLNLRCPNFASSSQATFAKERKMRKRRDVHLTVRNHITDTYQKI